MKKLLFIGLNLLAFSTSWSQSTHSLFNDYNKSIENPSFTGAGQGSAVSLSYQYERPDFNRQFLLFASQYSERIGWGLSLQRESLFVRKTTGVFANFSYNIPLSDIQNLYFGLRAGGDFYSMDASNIRLYDSFGQVTNNDPLLQSYSNKFQPNIGVGIHYQSPRFVLGLGIPSLLITKETEFKDGQVSKVANRFGICVFSKYIWEINENLEMHPFVKWFYIADHKSQLELGASLDYLHKVELGISYWHNESVNFFSLYNIPNTGFQLGYGFQYRTSEVASYLKNVHELVIQYRF